MGPEHVAICERLFEFGVIFAESLGKALLPVAPPLHPQKVVRRRQDKPECKKYVVNDSHSADSAISTRVLRVETGTVKGFFWEEVSGVE